MKILHISDLHLGKIVNGFSMIEDQKYILNQVLTTIESESVDTLVIAGDVYDRAIAPVEAIELWDDFLISVSKLKVTVLIINGNHDSMKRLNFASKLLETNNIHIVSTNKLFVQITIDKVNFFLLPFLSLELASSLLDNKINDFTILKQEIIKQIDIDENETNIIIDHSYIITGNKDIEADSAIRPLSLGGSEFTKGEVYNQFDLVLAGHVHRHSHIRPNIYYSGSILPYSSGERNNRQGYYIHQIGDTITSTYHPFDLKHPMREVAIYLDQIDEQLYSEDYIIIKLLDEGQIINPLEKIRTKFPNVMQIDREFRHLEINNSGESISDKLETSFADFYSLNSDQEISDDKLNYFLKVANDVIGGE